MPADREETPVHEPGDEDGAGHEAEQVAEGTEEEQLERAHRSGRVGRVAGTDPARREEVGDVSRCTLEGIAVC
jgi:hypothetical protein